MAWEQLTSMIKEARDIDQQERSAVPESCATDYTALVEAGEGGRFCPWCGLRWPEDASSWGEFPGAF